MRKHNWMLITLIFLILTQALAASSVTSTSPGADDWRTFRHDPSHSGAFQPAGEFVSLLQAAAAAAVTQYSEWFRQQRKPLQT